LSDRRISTFHSAASGKKTGYSDPCPAFSVFTSAQIDGIHAKGDAFSGILSLAGKHSGIGQLG
ncbi:MAG: hypothetical protein AB1547_05735, partial [Thermodesulfobacteriota bacterium]